MIPLKLIFCVVAAIFAAVTVISAQRRDPTTAINSAVITGLSLIAMEWAWFCALQIRRTGCAIDCEKVYVELGAIRRESLQVWS
jgi:NO-binding membrane sensor protein with MHYT domain